MKKLLFGLAVGQEHVKKCDVMIRSFREHNSGWETKCLSDKEIDYVIPNGFQRQPPAWKCEIGRWCFLKIALENHYDTVLYSDNDIYWYGEYKPVGHNLVLSPHYISDDAKKDACHWLLKDGVVNLGVIEGNGDSEVFGKFIDEVCANPIKHVNHNTLWLQNLASSLPHVGYDVVYNMDPSVNVARWNIAHNDRKIVFEDDKPYVVFNNEKSPLVSFHFSSKSLANLHIFGEEVRRLRDEYLGKLK